jgi:Lecithin retinol acyltransferase
MREIKVGDVLIRYLLPFSVWHYGMVVDVKSQNANDIFMLEFADSSGINKISLMDFMYGRKYVWVDNFDSEVKKATTFPINERIRRAYKLYREQKLTYTINKFNCEYFVRRCIFVDPVRWISKQTTEIGKNRLSVIGKISFMIGYGIIDKYLDLSTCESDMNPDKYGYEVCLTCGEIQEHKLKK